MADNIEKTKPDVSPKYKGKRPKSKEELEKDRAVTPSQYKAMDFVEIFTSDLTGAEAVNTANALQCLCNWKRDGGLKAVLKARWYINRLVKHLQKENKETKE